MLDVAATPALDAHNRSDHHRCGSHPDASWLCCQTHPQAERWARDHLQRQGFTVYLPFITVDRPDRVTPTLRHRIRVPMFRGYLFVADTGQWSPIQHTQGIARVLMAGPRPHHINASQIRTLQATEAQSPPDSGWKAPGVAVALRWGCFQGHRAVITAVDDDTADIAMIMFGQLRNLSVHTDCLVPAGDP